MSEQGAGGDGSGGGGGGGLPGWVWFVLIYVVGNAILYKTTGILLLPIPRK